jgi:hypothetical protein
MWSFEEFIDDRYTYIRSSATGNPCKKDHTPENKRLEQSATAESIPGRDEDTQTPKIMNLSLSPKGGCSE